ncbi:HAMP domain-containing protein [Roseovarius faecimaris]|uniref:histidine kinase n=1 Tax=Roseovarius faecimaris TaxID=2494550 RepID=A0A6I6IMQ5_9RHOB|nr:ATP-binding protein [Roseovarius faecimaris]QGX98299.1 HAMP domain-containing protein [Roseovarius faecimaris]
MSFRWLKPYLPRSLYGRAMLILLLPVITLLLVVSVVFIQRHFDGVSEQMTTSVSREVRLLLSEHPGGAAEIAGSTTARILQISAETVAPGDVPGEDIRQWYDLTGGVVTRHLHAFLPGLLAVELPDTQVVRLYFDHGGETIALSFDRRRASAANPHQLLVNMLVFGVLMTIVSFLYLRNQLRPITRLARAAEAFGRGRHEPYRPSGATEVRAAGNAFVNMRARIERQIEQRTLMLSGVSHDLRTPLTRLKLGLSMLEDEEAAPMRQDVADMERLLNEFLDFARGAQEGEPEPVDPMALVRQIVEDARRAELPVTLVEAEGAGQMRLREGGIRRAVENLIGNAVRYGARAEVSVVLSDKSLRIRVEDDGPGIPVERREEAMKPFTRLEPARNQNRGTGVGLGLSIALDIARAHGGTLRLAESAKLGGLRADIVIGR